MLCGWGRRDNNNKTIIHNVVKVELFNYKPIPKLERLLLVSPLALSIWNEPLFMHEARVCVSDASDGSRQLARQAASQPTSQLVRRRKICNPLCWHITKNTTRTTTNAYTNTHIYIHKHSSWHTHTYTRTHIHWDKQREIIWIWSVVGWSGCKMSVDGYVRSPPFRIESNLCWYVLFFVLLYRTTTPITARATTTIYNQQQRKTAIITATKVSSNNECIFIGRSIKNSMFHSLQQQQQ